jgi:magnesium chelatase family protein
VAARIAAARDRQATRYARLPAERRIRSNAELDGKLLDEIAEPDAEGRRLLNDAADRLGIR